MMPGTTSGYGAMRILQSGKDTRRTTVSTSHFLPDGGAEMSAVSQGEGLCCPIAGS